ncbi:DUF3052 family protein [Nocardioides mesophilus]|uniref:DUF3052 family protein n=1 Tax=Nocardioides mesophilus TaxID=433659 RepID=A0A7G9R9L2_9ACTN|nr:DUF3052 family protein [Nocardioides mesophilus]QNN52287.1 DUF3052 family protein [Nocardioides mesophilus]
MDTNPAGYSGKPLVEKLGVKPGLVVYVDHGPDHVDELLDGAPYLTRLPRQADLTLTFHTRRSGLARRLPTLVEHTSTAGMIWVCWPKKASKVDTDVTEDVVREVALPLGLVDVKVCAVDQTWSGLKLVRRRAAR